MFAGVGLVGTVAFAALGQELHWLLAWLPKLLSAVTIVIMLRGLWMIGAGLLKSALDHGQKQAAAPILQTIVSRPIHPLATASDCFELKTLASPTKVEPAIQGSWFSMAEDHALLTRYARALDEHRSRVETRVNGAIGRFTQDRLTVLEQQRQVLRRALTARALLAHLTDLPNVDLDLEHLPRLASIAVPRAPSYLRPEEYAKKYAPLPKNASVALSRMLFSGGRFNTTNLAATAVTAAIVAVRAKSNVSRAVRTLEIIADTVIGHCIEARTTVALLARGHEELVTTSLRIKQACDEIETLSANATELPKETASLAALTGPQQETAKTLWYWILAADQVARQQAA